MASAARTTLNPPEAPPAPVPERPTLPRMRDAVQACRACELWAGATQAVFGEGPARAEAVLVGEQPGDREDVAGAPFVGPAGRPLDSPLAADVSVTVHPSAILRAPDAAARHAAYDAFVEDLRRVAGVLGG